jgi:hypothetical protein
MAGSKSNYLENATLDALYGSGTPTNIFVALYTVAPSDSGGGTEVSGTGYARKSITNNATNWPAASSGVKTLAGTHAFATAGSNWGTIVAAATFDAVDGNMLHWATLTNSRTIFAGDVFSLAAGDIQITED